MIDRRPEDEDDGLFGPALVVWTVAIAVAVIVLVLGLAAPSDDAAAGDAGHRDAGAPAPVRGVVRARRQATVTTDVPLLAVEVPYREGERFPAGAPLVTFDCRRQRAERAAAHAQLREAELVLDSNRHLDRHNAVGKNEVAVAKARADRAEAEVAGLDARLDDCRFLAPFAGRIVDLGIRPHERTVPQRPYLSIIDDGELEIETIVPSDMLQVLAPGVRFTFAVDELGARTVDAEVVSVAAAVDPVSKTVKVVGRITRSVDGILAGMSGSAEFATGH
jgi:RND family efflux transporter MFP subunit